ncbi:acyltransferase [Streptomyces bambusae]|uniref:acyltransferase family protein n=1 Tax=Streptomyces bambusae TaxID=1550616 RepID=UPI001CFCE88D|nr:acyltransferase [Streptomyces bambusae]MCB5164954.1 acyltransferase [Streptomyces bambusae]
MSLTALSPTVARTPDVPVGCTSLPSLTGLRFAAALAVFAHHLALPELSVFGGRAAEWTGRVFGVAGGLGVTFFFLLSGFILTWSAAPGDTAGRFVRRRLAKLVPNHLVTFAAALALIAWATTGWQQALPNLFLVQAWSWDPAVSFSVNIPSWSLSCELLFYLAFPALLRLVRRISPTRLWGWAAAVAALIVAVPALATALLPGAQRIPGWPVSAVQNWFVYQFPPVRMAEFVLGMLLARIVLADRWIGIRPLHALVLLAAAYPLALNVPYLYGLTAVWVVPLALLIPAVAIADLRGRPSLLRHPAVHWLGEVSFAFYLVQAIVLIGATRYLTLHKPYDTVAALALCLLALAVTLGLAHLLHRYVERPAMRRWASAGRSDGRRAEARSGA